MTHAWYIVGFVFALLLALFEGLLLCLIAFGSGEEEEL